MDSRLASDTKDSPKVGQVNNFVPNWFSKGDFLPLIAKTWSSGMFLFAPSGPHRLIRTIAAYHNIIISTRHEYKEPW